MMKNDTCQVLFNSTQLTQKMIDTIQNNFELIHTMLESWMNRFKQKIIRYKHESIHYKRDMIHTKSESPIFVLRAK
jgi:hypothetical protein